MKRNYYDEAMYILEQKYPELKLDTWRYATPFMGEILPEHLRALWNKIQEILEKEK